MTVGVGGSKREEIGDLVKVVVEWGFLFLSLREP